MGEIIVRPKPSIPMAFTGERLTSEYGGQTQIEHLHRYLLAREWCRGKNVLDVASGEGYGTALLAQVASNAVGVEIAQDAVEHANRAYETSNLRFIQGDARALPSPDAAFDVVVSFETIEHFAEHAKFIKEVRRVLKPGGLFIVSTPDRDNYSPAETPANPFHIQELTQIEFVTLLQSQFGEVSILLQRPVFGSILLAPTASRALPLCFERRGEEHFEGSVGLSRPQYLIAFASDTQIQDLPASVYVDTGKLGMLSPAEMQLHIDATTAQMAQLQDELAHAKGGVDLTAANEAAENTLAAVRSELDRTKDEVVGLVAANEMAKSALATSGDELARTNAELAGLRAAIEIAETARAAAGDEIARTKTEVAGLMAANKIAETARAAVGDELDRTKGEVAGLMAANEMAEGALAAIRDELARTKGEVLGLVAANEMAEAALAAIRGEVRGVEDRASRAEAQKRLAEAQNDAVLASTSWRLTKPVRAISRSLLKRS